MTKPTKLACEVELEDARARRDALMQKRRQAWFGERRYDSDIERLNKKIRQLEAEVAALHRGTASSQPAPSAASTPDPDPATTAYAYFDPTTTDPDPAADPTTGDPDPIAPPPPAPPTQPLPPTSDDDDDDPDDSDDAIAMPRWPLLLLVVALVALLGYGIAAASPAPAAMVPHGFTAPFTTSTTDPTPDNDEVADNDPVQDDEVAELQEQMTVDLDELQVNEYADLVNNDWSLLCYSLSTYDTARARESGISDAVSLPFSSETDTTVIEAELYQEILRNPVYGIGLLNFLQDVQVGDQTIGDLNPWIAEVIARNEDGGCNNWVEYASATDKTIVVTDEYKLYASGICTLLSRMKVEGIGEYKTTENWSLNAALLNSERKMAPSSYQYQGDFIVYTYFGKDGQALLSVGFNLRDKRPALITELAVLEPVAEAVEESQRTYQPTTPSTTVPVNPPGGGGDTPPDNPPTTTYTKDPAKDPAPQGNANKGGGTNDDPGPGTYEEPHKSTSTGSSAVTGNNDNAGSSTTGNTGSSSSDTGSTPPATTPIEPTESTPGEDNATGESGDLAESNNTGTITMPD